VTKHARCPRPPHDAYRERKAQIAASELEQRGRIDERVVQKRLQARNGAVQIAELGDAALAQGAGGQLLPDGFEHATPTVAQQGIDEEQELLTIVQQDGVERGAGSKPIEGSVGQQTAWHFFGQQQERRSAVLAFQRFEHSSQKPASESMRHAE
jgi:hypothetical protein